MNIVVMEKKSNGVLLEAMLQEVESLTGELSYQVKGATDTVNSINASLREFETRFYERQGLYGKAGSSERAGNSYHST